MIHKESWYRESQGLEERLDQLRRQVARGDKSSVLPYLQLLERAGLLGKEPLPELSWLLNDTQRLQQEVIEPFHDDVSLYGLLGKGAKDPTHPRSVLQRLEVGIRTLESLVQGKGSDLPGNLKWIYKDISLLLKHLNQVDELKGFYEKAIAEAKERISQTEEAKEFREQYENELEEMATRSQILDVVRDVLVKIHNQVTFSDPEPHEEGYPDMQDLLPELLSDVENLLDYLDMEIGQIIYDIRSKGWTAQPFEGSLDYQWMEFENKFHEALGWLEYEHPNVHDSLQEYLEKIRELEEDIP